MPKAGDTPFRRMDLGRLGRKQGHDPAVQPLVCDCLEGIRRNEPVGWRGRRSCLGTHHADKLRKEFHRTFWNGNTTSLRAIRQPDDRAQALAVVSGVLPKELYPVIRPFFSTWYHASPYMEKYVLEALCTMGYYQDALNRMKLRYRAMIESPLTTLWEGWGIGSEGFGGGTYNHAWSGGPLTILHNTSLALKRWNRLSVRSA